MNGAAKFSAERLRQCGFREVAPGKWGAKSFQDDDPESSIANVERHSRRIDQGADGIESQGETKVQGGLAGVEGHKEGRRYRLIVHSFRVKLIDASNPYLKALEDELTKAGVFPDDGPAFCDQPIFLQTTVMPGDERTEVEVLSYE